MVCVIAAVVLGAMALTASAGTWLSSGKNAAKSLPPKAAQQNSAPVGEQGIIRLLASGFDSAEVSGPAGRYRIVATRASREEQVTLQLKRADGELVEEFVMPQEKLDWTTVIELQVGSYTLGVVNRPEWTCRITVQ